MKQYGNLLNLNNNKTMQNNKRNWSEIKCDYYNGEGFWTVDAWVTDDENEEGKVIAVIDDISGNVYYIDATARYDAYAQEIIQDKVSEIKNKF